MIITKTPFRMSFFGGGTDIPQFFNKYGGAVISTTFDKFCLVNVKHLPRFFKFTSEVVYAKIERVKSIDKIAHPLIRNAMKMMDMHELRLSYEADLPARTGLGTSSSFAVGMVNAFYALKGKVVDKKTLADKAIHLERVLCGESGGWQDQIAAAYGGLNRIDFGDKDYKVERLDVSPERKKRLNDNLLLYFTGFTRYSSEIQKATTSTLKKKVSQLKEMLALVDEAQKILTDESYDLDDFGRLLAVEWELKRQTGSKISNETIDRLYQTGINAGALGGKLLGAGGGGFLLFYVQPEKRQSVMEAMKKLMCIPFEFEENGTQIIYNTPEFYNYEGSKEK